MKQANPCNFIMEDGAVCGCWPALRSVGQQLFCKMHVPEAFKAAAGEYRKQESRHSLDTFFEKSSWKDSH